MLTSCSWFFIWFSACLASSSLASRAACLSASRRAASCSTFRLSSSSRTALSNCICRSVQYAKAINRGQQIICNRPVSSFCQKCYQFMWQVKNVPVPFSAFLAFSSNWESLNIISRFSLSICSFSFSMFSLFFFSVSSRALKITSIHY